jgi:hypothetical protein
MILREAGTGAVNDLGFSRIWEGIGVIFLNSLDGDASPKEHEDCFNDLRA